MEAKSYLCPSCGKQTLLFSWLQVDGEISYPICDLCSEFYKDLRMGLWNAIGEIETN